jgi:hypothetical protein
LEIKFQKFPSFSGVVGDRSLEIVEGRGKREKGGRREESLRGGEERRGEEPESRGRRRG